MFYRTLACLPALTGAWADRGGGIAKSVGSYGDALIDVARSSAPTSRWPAGATSPRTLNMSRLGEILTAPHAGETDGPGVHAFIVWNCNPLVIVPNAELVRRGLERDDLFTVVHEQFLTDTARYADIVLPATTQIESDDVVLPWGHLWAGWNGAAIDPLGESCSNTEFFRRLAGAMGYTEPSLFDDDETLLRQRSRRSTSTNSAGRLGRVPRIPTMVDRSATVRFETPSGRVEFASDQLERMGQPAPAGVRATPRGSGRRSRTRRPLSAAAAHPQAPHPIPQLGVRPTPQARTGRGWTVRRTRRRRCRRPGSGRRRHATVWNDRASVEVPVKVTDRLRPGVVAIPFGWWSAPIPTARSPTASPTTR